MKTHSYRSQLAIRMPEPEPPKYSGLEIVFGLLTLVGSAWVAYRILH